MYRQLYDMKYVQHWTKFDFDNLELDLHNFSRGMAFAAVYCALHEVI